MEIYSLNIFGNIALSARKEIVNPAYDSLTVINISSLLCFSTIKALTESHTKKDYGRPHHKIG